MRKTFYQTIIIVAVLSMLACSDRQNHNSSSVIESTSMPVDSVPLLYTIKKDDVVIRSGPGEKFPRLINEKATEALHETQYCTVDRSVKAEVLAKKANWTKIRIIEPEWLSDTHVGWIPDDVLVSVGEVDSITTITIDPKEYEVIVTDHRPAVQNFHVWLKRKRFDEDYVFAFTKAFRKKHCSMQCNVAVYDSRSIKSLVLVYPLNDREYLRLADHLISLSTFDAVEVRDWYPYQDFHYKELGGRNWKKNKAKY
ncbi:hypothetical protein [Mucilaginibacter terrae]|uniref:SH3 domain-containing protein n=1 Tax=Mucilaginibacter terrae TaxID=1955052 RepID=A0ABU3GR46_9SPHI|nr:hypothetical protein [Mucilaginibacter terrae]MDT3402257.1 hypothetical protein [Mucilaginibacter terrae]